MDASYIARMYRIDPRRNHVYLPVVPHKAVAEVSKGKV